MAELLCPLCGSEVFDDHRNVPAIRCRTCKSDERTRAVKLFLDRHLNLKTGQKVLHFAPERRLGKYIADAVGTGYDAVDIDPERYSSRSGYQVRSLDLCTEASKLPSDFYDLVLHNHVMEHVPCNVTLVLQHLHRAVKPGGVHMFSIPILSGYFEEDLDPNLTEPERTARFGQGDHMRRFGREDFDRTVGPIVGVTAAYSLADHFSDHELRTANIRKSQWTCSGSSVFFLRKQ